MSDSFERTMYLSGNDDRDFDALLEFLPEKFSFEFFEPNKMNMYVTIHDNDECEDWVLDVYDAVTIYWSEDDNEWFLWQ